ncbi:MAG: LuxR C-terminal-related transcriptional regulator [Chloroflexi bacterium]|nr:LuxR C-terminal-related transcriptional regulator [Chloroflexota bacterium]
MENLSNGRMIEPDSSDGQFINHLLATKLEKPQIAARLVDRNRLTKILSSSLKSKVSLVVAPAGYGKTTLLGEWISKRLPSNWRVAWVSLDSYDNRVVRFWSYITKALQQIYPKLKINFQQLNQSQSDLENYSYLNLIINEISASTHSICLVLDDYHLITDDSIHRSLSYFIEHQPRNFHLVISSRTMPPIPLSRLRALGQLVEVSTSDLSFTQEEVNVFLANVMGLVLEHDQVVFLANATEGWIAGLKLAALSMHGNKDLHKLATDLDSDYGHIFDFLIEEVLNNQDIETREFLLKTSVLSEFSGPLCNVVLERSDSQQILNQIALNQLFTVSLDKNQNWYRYHHLFAETLRKLLVEKYPESKTLVLKKATEWFLENGYSDKAVSCALDSGDLQSAARIIDQCALSAVTHYNLDRLIQWINRLSMDLIEERPQLGIYVALAYFLEGNFEKIKTWLVTTEHILSRRAGKNQTERQKNYIRWEIAALRAVMKCFTGDITSGMAEIIELRENAPQEDVYFVGSMTHILAESYVVTGKLDDGLQEYYRGMEFAVQHKLIYEYGYSLTGHAQVLKMQGCLSLLEQDYYHLLEYAIENKLGEVFLAYAKTGLAEIAIERNQLENAAHFVSEIENQLEIIENEPTTWIRPEFLYVRLSKCYYAFKNMKKAQFYFDQALKGFYEKPNAVPFLSSDLIDMQVRLWLSVNENQGNLARSVNNQVRQDKLIHESLMHGLYELDPHKKAKVAIKIATARAYLSSSKELEAIVILDEISSFVHQAGMKEREIEALILLARCWNDKGERNISRQYLYRALVIAEPEGNLRLFLEEDQSVHALLVDILTWLQDQETEKGNKKIIDFTRQIIENNISIENYDVLQNLYTKPPVNEFSPLLNLLSNREEDVIELLCKGKTVKEISAELMVTVNTTKTHLRGIYKKLGVHTKKEAIRLVYDIRKSQ